ncbi:MAG: hypothetical protein ACTS4Y_00645 [Candidatus Hodgkinia cicadicola]
MKWLCDGGDCSALSDGERRTLSVPSTCGGWLNPLERKKGTAEQRKIGVSLMTSELSNFDLANASEVERNYTNGRGSERMFKFKRWAQAAIRGC